MLFHLFIVYFDSTACNPNSPFIQERKPSLLLQLKILSPSVLLNTPIFYFMFFLTLYFSGFFLGSGTHTDTLDEPEVKVHVCQPVISSSKKPHFTQSSSVCVVLCHRELPPNSHIKSFIHVLPTTALALLKQLNGQIWKNIMFPSSFLVHMQYRHLGTTTA